MNNNIEVDVPTFPHHHFKSLLTMKKLLILLIYLWCAQAAVAQSVRAYEASGDEAIQKQDYNAALEYYNEALIQDTKNTALTFKYAEAARLFNSYNLAVTNYKKVVNAKESANYPLAKFWLGVMLKNTGDYKSAKATFEDLLMDTKKVSDDVIALSKKEIKTCDWAIEMLKKPIKVDIKHFDKNINSLYSDFAAIEYHDSLYYSSLRFKNPKDDHNPPRLIAKILSTKDTVSAKPDKKLNSETEHTAYTTFDKRGRLIFAQGRYSEDGSDITCALYMRKPESKSWGEAVRLPDFINIKGSTTTMPCIGIDKNGQETLYFVSDRKDGKGKLDIWYSTLDKSGNFTFPVNLAQLNTRSNEASPFYDSNTGTLYFSADGANTLGGYDIFSSANTKSGWLAPQNEGYPINTSYNDLYFSLNKDGSTGYLSSNRLGSFFLDKKNETCCYDIYQFKYKEPKKPLEEPKKPETSLVVNKDKPKNNTTSSIQKDNPKPTNNGANPPKDVLVNNGKNPKQGDSTPPIKENSTPDNPKNTLPNFPPDKGGNLTLESFLPLPLYFDNDEPDKRTRNKTTTKTYTNTFDSYMAQKNKYITEASRGLDQQTSNEIEDKLNDFFENKVKKNQSNLLQFSPILLGKLYKGEKIELIVKGYASRRAKNDYNLILSARRVSSLVNYFKTYENGLFQKYFNNGQLKITEISFGEDLANVAVSDDLNNEKASIYSVDAMMDRRIEIIEVKMK